MCADQTRGRSGWHLAEHDGRFEAVHLSVCGGWVRFKRLFDVWREATLAPFQFTTFRVLWIAATGAYVGAFVQTAGAAWAMTELTNSPTMIALVQTAVSVPIFLVSLPAGVLADLWNRKRLMLGAQLAGLTAAASLLIVAYAGALTPPILLLFTTVISAATALFQPPWMASFGDLTSREHVPAIMGLHSISLNLSRTAGPTVGGFLIAAFDARATFALNAIACLWLVVVLATWRGPVRQGPSAQSFLSGLAWGLHHVLASPPLLSTLARLLLFGFGGSVVLALAPVAARDLLMGGPTVYGVLVGAFGFGALMAATNVAAMRAALGNSRMIAAATLLFAMAAMGLGFAASLPLFLLFTVLSGIAWSYAFTTLYTCVQFLSAPHWLGRATAFAYVAMAGGAAAGAACWGWVADEGGLPSAYMAAGAFFAGTLLASIVAPIPTASARAE